MKCLVLWLTLVLIAGCASKPLRVVKIESEPSGARVFFGVGPDERTAIAAREFVGTTPCQFTPRQQNRHGEFDVEGIPVYSAFRQAVAMFMAEPPSGATNLFARSQVFHCETVWKSADMVPSGVFFDLTKPE